MKRSNAQNENAGNGSSAGSGRNTNVCGERNTSVSSAKNENVDSAKNTSVGNGKNRNAIGRQLNQNNYSPSGAEGDGPALAPLVTFVSPPPLAFY